MSTSATARKGASAGVRQIAQLVTQSYSRVSFWRVVGGAIRLVRGETFVLLGVALSACGSDGSVAPPPPPAPVQKQLVVQGRLERGLAVRFASVTASDTTPVAVGSIVVTPAASAQIAGDSVLFIQAGAIHIAATVSGTTIAIDTTIAIPPSIVFDALAQGNRDIYRSTLDGVGLTRLTTSSGEDSHPTAANQLIVFTSFRDGNGELYQIHADGSGEQRLSTAPSDETLAAISPNGQSIAYVKNSNGTSKVWLASASFGNPTPLTAGGASNALVVESGVAWAPASDRLVFVSTATPSGRSGLFLVASTGTSTATWVNGSGALGPEVEPSWSSSGSKIAYASARGDTTTIFVRDVTTGVETQIVHGRRSLGQPAWLADGRIVFTDFSAANPVLAWVDPASPAVIHTIPTAGMAAQHAAPLVLP